MAPLRSLGNALSSFRDFYASTRTDASSAAPSGPSPITASGGNQTTATGFTNGGYKYHVFTSSGALTVSSGNDEIEFLVVAGGGGGGWGNGGAGGAGGLRTNDPGVPAPIKISDPSLVNFFLKLVALVLHPTNQPCDEDLKSSAFWRKCKGREPIGR